MCQWRGEEVSTTANTPRTTTETGRDDSSSSEKYKDADSSSERKAVEKENNDESKHTWRETISEKFSNISKEDIKNGAINITGKIFATLISGAKDFLKATLSPVTINKLEVLKERFMSEVAPQFIKGYESMIEGYKEAFLVQTEIDKNNNTDVDNEPKDKSTTTDTETNVETNNGVNNNHEEEKQNDVKPEPEQPKEETKQDKTPPVEKPTPEQKEANAEYKAAREDYTQYKPEGAARAEDIMKIPEGLRGTYENVIQIYNDYKEGKISYEEYKDKMDRSTAQSAVLEVAITRIKDVNAYEKAMRIATDPYEGMAKQNEDGSFTIERDLKGAFARFEHIPEGTVLPSVETFKEAHLSEITQIYTDLISGNMTTDEARDVADDFRIGDFRANMGEYDYDGSFKVYEEYRYELHNPNSDFHKEAGEPFITDDYSLQGISKIISYNTQEAMEIREEQKYIRETFYDD